MTALLIMMIKMRRDDNFTHIAAATLAVAGNAIKCGIIICKHLSIILYAIILYAD